MQRGAYSDTATDVELGTGPQQTSQLHSVIAQGVLHITIRVLAMIVSRKGDFEPRDGTGPVKPGPFPTVQVLIVVVTEPHKHEHAGRSCSTSSTSSSPHQTQAANAVVRPYHAGCVAGTTGTGRRRHHTRS